MVIVKRGFSVGCCMSGKAHLHLMKLLAVATRNRVKTLPTIRPGCSCLFQVVGKVASTEEPFAIQWSLC